MSEWSMADLKRVEPYGDKFCTWFRRGCHEMGWTLGVDPEEDRKLFDAKWDKWVLHESELDVVAQAVFVGGIYQYSLANLRLIPRLRGLPVYREGA